MSMAINRGEIQAFSKTGGNAIKLQILHAVDRNLLDMTVDEICEKAGVSRQAFYRNFSSKYDIFTWHAVGVEELYLDEVGRTIDWATGYFHHFRLLAQERDAYCVGLQYTYGLPFGAAPTAAHRKEILLDTIKNFRGIKVNDSLVFCIDSFAKLETELAVRWFREGLKDPEIFAAYMTAVVPHLLLEAMDG